MEKEKKKKRKKVGRVRLKWKKRFLNETLRNTRKSSKLKENTGTRTRYIILKIKVINETRLLKG